jgi:hypothetical protein
VKWKREEFAASEFADRTFQALGAELVILVLDEAVLFEQLSRRMLEHREGARVQQQSLYRRLGR